MGKIVIEGLRNEVKKLERERDSLIEEVDAHRHGISRYGELESMGFGLNKLKLLWHTVRVPGVLLTLDKINVKKYDKHERKSQKLKFKYRPLC